MGVMHLLDDMPDIGACPHCGHDGNGLQFAVPDSAMTGAGRFNAVQAACLACGEHGPTATSYDDALKRFRAGETEAA